MPGQELQTLFAQYDAIHRNRVNRAMHCIGTPMIVFAVIGLLGAIPVDSTEMTAGSAFVPWRNLGLPVVVALTVWYTRCSRVIGYVFATFALIAMYIAHAIEIQLGVTNAALAFGAVFVCGWAVQFTGHYFEGVAPRFVSRPVNLLIGPAAVIVDLLDGSRLRTSDEARG